ncbi:unnamed protein product [Phytophthora lilii]|uniref:Unnamed protein product n=1 Tax=Phytophthora lilii TaxID=2077276 RepID=A0A9W6X980_9STRA|nr:unnamed protein product [Phytophthora lilii]
MKFSPIAIAVAAAVAVAHVAAADQPSLRAVAAPAEATTAANKGAMNVDGKKKEQFWGWGGPFGGLGWGGGWGGPWGGLGWGGLGWGGGWGW